MLKPVRRCARTAHPNIIKVHDSAGTAERDRLPAFDKIGTSNRLSDARDFRSVATFPLHVVHIAQTQTIFRVKMIS